MPTSFPLMPPSASTVATEMDLLYLFITVVSAFFVVLVAALVFFFAVESRRRHPDDVGADIHGSLVLELTWTVIPFSPLDDHVRVGRGSALPPLTSTCRRDGLLRRRQAVDVEGPASIGRTGDQ